MACRRCWRIPPWAEPYVAVLVLVVALGFPAALVYSLVGNREFKVQTTAGPLVLKKGMAQEDVENLLKQKISTYATPIKGLRQGMYIRPGRTYQIEFKNRKLVFVSIGPSMSEPDEPALPESEADGK